MSREIGAERLQPTDCVLEIHFVGSSDEVPSRNQIAAGLEAMGLDGSRVEAASLTYKPRWKTRAQ